MSLITNVSEWHKLWSIRLSILSAAFGAVIATYATLPIDWLPVIPNWLKLVCAIGTFVAPVSSAVSRVIQQNNVKGSSS
jgi:hypothetical protein